jgi:hypothetical protein
MNPLINGVEGTWVKLQATSLTNNPDQVNVG